MMIPEVGYMKRKKKYWIVLTVLVLLTGALALVGLFPAACDWYTDHIYGHLCDGISRLTALLPAALGELLMYLGILLLLFGLLLLILLIFLRRKAKFRRFCAGYFKTLLMMLVCLVLWYMPCWFIPFCGTVLGKGENTQRTEFTVKELGAVTAFAISGLNQAAEEIEITPDGRIDFPDTAEYHAGIEAALLGISDEFPRLTGYYPPVKNALCSDILKRMNIGGYNYPFTMEPTHNKYLSPIWQPVLDTHELAHHKGYYKENEGNFISQIALIQSDDPFLRFSGFYDMVQWTDAAWTESTDRQWEELQESGQIQIPPLHDVPEESIKQALEMLSELWVELFGAVPPISDRAEQIVDIANNIRREIYEAEEHPIDDMPAVQEIIEDTAETGWKVQGEILQENSYDGVVLLLLQYFDGKLFTENE